MPFIDKEKLLHEISLNGSTWAKDYHFSWSHGLEAKNRIVKLIEEQPTVDAEPVRHGRWIDEYNGKYSNPRYICSNCKGKALYDFERDALGNYKEVQVLTEHCPHCGAKMDEEAQ